jgi:glucose-6-phosphate dehydrogenase assembly protein OpcA
MQARDSKSIDIASIEKELTALWKEAEEGEDARPVVRACSMNLIVLGGDDPSVVEVLDLLSAEHPARTFLLSVDETSDAQPIDAWVAARCAVPLPGEKQVCSEQIHLIAEAGYLARLPSVVSSLLVADIPVVLWHRGANAVTSELAGPMHEFSDLVIFDSHDDAGLRESISLLDSEDSPAFGDLAWERGETWRNLLAQVFDSPGERHLLNQLDGITIRYAAGSGPDSSGLSTGLLFQGWLCHSLGLRGKLKVEAEGQFSGSFNMSGRTVHTTIGPEKRNGEKGSPIRGLHLAFGSTSLAFSVNDSGNCFRSIQKDGRGQSKDHSIPQRSQSDAEILSHLLRTLDPDPRYRSSLAALVELLPTGK